MPVGSRVRANNVYGTVTDNPLLIGAVSFTSQGLNLLPAISASQHAVIVLDPKRVFGDPEIVVITNHTAMGTTATITRGQYGTSARAHNQGTAWAHVPVGADDYIAIVTSGSRPSNPYLGQLIFESDTDKFIARNAANTVWQDVVDLGAWDSYTPTFTNLTVGSGTLEAAFTRMGRTILYRIKWVFGAGSSVATGPTYTLPVPPHATYTANYPMASEVKYLDAGTTVFTGTSEFASGSTVTLLVEASAAASVDRASVTSAVPMTWTTGDTIFISGTYEAAT